MAWSLYTNPSSSEESHIHSGAVKKTQRIYTAKVPGLGTEATYGLSKAPLLVLKGCHALSGDDVFPLAQLPHPHPSACSGALLESFPVSPLPMLSNKELGFFSKNL